MSFGRRVKELRDHLGLTQEELAARIGVDRSYISQMEHGKPKSPSLQLVRALARELGTSPEDLLAAALYPSGRSPAVLSDPELDLMVQQIRELPHESRATLRALLDHLLIEQRKRRAGHTQMAASTAEGRPLTEAEQTEVERQARTVRRDESDDLD